MYSGQFSAFSAFRGMMKKTRGLFYLPDSFLFYPSATFRRSTHLHLSKDNTWNLGIAFAFRTRNMTERAMGLSQDSCTCSSFPTVNSTLSLASLHSHNYSSPLSTLAVNRASTVSFISGCYFCTMTDSTYLIKVPNMGDSITEGTIGMWKKAVGDIVAGDEVICVVETDKVSVDIHADIGGRIISHAAEEGETVYVGGDLVTLDVRDNELPLTELVQLRDKSTTFGEPSDVPFDAKAHASSRSFYKSSIQFPVRKNIIATKQNLEIIVERISSSEEPAVENVSRYEEGNLPSKYKPRLLTDEEISAINTGGIFENKDWVAGKWKTIVQENRT
ncbi:putative dihydrolipoamide acyltransferase [Cardiosporidium cionae]|uniref:Dihydrolipoamide acyltransferase n=1 Tax=Cardiosporidium cionae TaxID=476202 RepID=A0ABQ7J5C2_9APIC|nr:putative dihydrolipoamide acyltransferase [Cardiosporidium cionae]|eukprot:KAF8819171.1 putative dihydrolipoamide acyltransferase [Cardiosporidium cionae]